MLDEHAKAIDVLTAAQGKGAAAKQREADPIVTNAEVTFRQGPDVEGKSEDEINTLAATVVKEATKK